MLQEMWSVTRSILFAGREFVKETVAPVKAGWDWLGELADQNTAKETVRPFGQYPRGCNMAIPISNFCLYDGDLYVKKNACGYAWNTSHPLASHKDYMLILWHGWQVFGKVAKFNYSRPALENHSIRYPKLRAFTPDDSYVLVQHIDFDYE